MGHSKHELFFYIYIFYHNLLNVDVRKAPLPTANAFSLRIYLKIKVSVAESRHRSAYASSLSTIPGPEGRIAVPNHHFHPSHNNLVLLPTDSAILLSQSRAPISY